MSASCLIHIFCHLKIVHIIIANRLFLSLKFPRNSLDRNEDGFINTLTDREQEILASYMKVEWLNRSIMTWQNIKPLYDERDFSQANMLSKLTTALENEKKKAHFLESNYYRSINNKPYDYSKLAGSKNG